MEYAYIFGSVLVVSAASLIGLFTISLRTDLLKRVVFLLVAVAAGALFGNALLHLLPEAYEQLSDVRITGLFVFIGILLFFMLEKFLRWQHVHDFTPAFDNCDPEHGSHTHPVGSLILVADGVHNFIDGTIIAAAYLTSVELGIAATLAILLHEIPQEVGDFGLLLHAGYTRMRAILFNFFSALAALLGAVVALLASQYLDGFVPYILALSAGGFVYIAGSDILPELHKTTSVRRSLMQLVALVAGFLLIGALIPEHHEDAAAPAEFTATYEVLE